MDRVRMLRGDAGSDVAGDGAGDGTDEFGGRLRRPAARAARWAARLCFGLAALLLIGLAEFLALKLLAG